MNGVSEPVNISNIKKEPIDTGERSDGDYQESIKNYRQHLIGPFAVNEPIYTDERKSYSENDKSRASDSDMLSIRISSSDGADSITSLESDKLSYNDEIGGELKYECHLCSAKFRSARAFRGHTNAHRYTSEGQSASFLPCSPFPGPFSPKPDQTNGTFKCDGCQKIFYSRDTYAMHMMLRAKNENCSLSKSALSQMNIDLKEEKNERVKMNIEAILSSFGHSPWNPMDLHKMSLRKSFDYRPTHPTPESSRQHGSSDVLACAVCGEVMHSKDSLAMHMLFHARGDGNEDNSPKPLPLPPLALPTMRDYANALALAGNKIKAARNMAVFHQAAVNLSDKMYFNSRSSTQQSSTKHAYEPVELGKGMNVETPEADLEIEKDTETDSNRFNETSPITPTSPEKNGFMGSNLNYSSDIEGSKSDTALELDRHDTDTPMDLVIAKADEMRPKSLDGGMKISRISEKRYGKYKNYQRLKMRSLLRKYSKQNLIRRQHSVSDSMSDKREERSPILETNPMISKELLASHSVTCYCQFCEIIYLDRTLYQLHMGLHNVNNPWQCNACGKVCENRLEFSSHVLHY